MFCVPSITKLVHMARLQILEVFKADVHVWVYVYIVYMSCKGT